MAPSPDAMADWARGVKGSAKRQMGLGEAVPTSSTREAVDQQATFICGHPKSGTSLLLAMLDSHPQLIVFPEETAFFRRFHREAASRTPEERAGMAEDLILHVFHWDPDHPHPSQSTRDGRPWAGNSMFGQEFDAISQAPLGRFQDELEPVAGRTLEALLKPEMAKLGYDRYYPIAWVQSIAAIGVRGIWKARDWLGGAPTIG